MDGKKGLELNAHEALNLFCVPVRLQWPDLTRAKTSVTEVPTSISAQTPGKFFSKFTKQSLNALRLKRMPAHTKHLLKTYLMMTINPSYYDYDESFGDDPGLSWPRFLESQASFNEAMKKFANMQHLRIVVSLMSVRHGYERYVRRWVLGLTQIFGRLYALNRIIERVYYLMSSLTAVLSAFGWRRDYWLDPAPKEFILNPRPPSAPLAPPL